jgi:hypothetical protein
VVGEEEDAVDEVTGEDAPLVVGGFLPDPVDVEVAKLANDVFRGFQRRSGFGGLRQRRGFKCLYLRCQGRFLLGEQVGCDLAGAAAR